jgi:hypothetical protein
MHINSENCTMSQIVRHLTMHLAIQVEAQIENHVNKMSLV